MPTLDITEYIHLDDGDYQFVEKSYGYVRLRKDSDGSYLDLHVSELARRTVGMVSSKVLNTVTPVTPRTLDSLREIDRHTTFVWSGHIQEIITGQHPDRPDTRPQYDLGSTSQNERVTAKIAELRAANLPASRTSIMKKISGFRSQGAAGIIDLRHARTFAPLEHLDALVKDALCYVIAAQANKSTGTKSRLIAQTKAELLKRHGNDGPPLPSTTSWYRYIAALTEGKHTTRSAKTRASLANRPTRAFALKTQLLPGMELQVDSTPMDILVKAPSGAIVRAILTIMMDIASRSIVGFTIRLVATKGVDHVALLAQTLTPAQNRPDKSKHRQAVQALNPQAELLSDEERQSLLDRQPFIHPRRIMMDNGRDYISETFLAAAQKFGIGVTFSAPHTPTDKGIVERQFHTISTMFTQHLPGYTGRSAEHRGYEVEKENLLDVYALYELFDDWVLKTWQNRTHSSLHDRLNPAVKLSPNEAFAASAELTSTLYIPLTADDFIDLLPSEYRHITTTGITFANREYDSPELHSLRGTRSRNAGRKYRWEFKYDPYNYQAVWVRDSTGGWIECRARNEAALLNPHLGERSPVEPSDRTAVAITNAAINGVHLHRALSAAPHFVEVDENDDETAIALFNPLEN